MHRSVDQNYSEKIILQGRPSLDISECCGGSLYIFAVFAVNFKLQ